jgi:hypothetical protein
VELGKKENELEFYKQQSMKVRDDYSAVNEQII